MIANDLFSKEEINWIVNAKLINYCSEINPDKGSVLVIKGLDKKSDAYIQGAIEADINELIEYSMDINYQNFKEKIDDILVKISESLETKCIMVKHLGKERLKKIVEPFCGTSMVSIISQKINGSEPYAFDTSATAIRIGSILNNMFNTSTDIRLESLSAWAKNYKGGATIIGADSPNGQCAEDLVYTAIKTNSPLALSFYQDFLTGHSSVGRLGQSHRIEFINAAKGYHYPAVLIAKPKK